MKNPGNPGTFSRRAGGSDAARRRGSRAAARAQRSARGDDGDRRSVEGRAAADAVGLAA